MIFVIGGRNQGKTVFVNQLLNRKEYPLVMDGRKDDAEAMLRADIILHYESLVRRLMEKRVLDPVVFTERLLSENPEAVITADEIGCGVVPMGAFEREYRETDGRICQRIASAADEVYRVICGIGTRIK